MCGIAGAVSFAGPPDLAALAAASERLKLRGPDDSGQWSEGQAALANRRLAVIDLSPGGHQPMVSRDGRYVCVQNGEIYNFRELRPALEAKGFSWRSESDTEVLLSAYQAWGADCVLHLRGMFAVAVWDRAERTLFIARDRMGVKPLYYAMTPSAFVFASRPSAVASFLPPDALHIDEQALRYYLDLGYFPGETTLHAAIRKLPPGHALTLRDGQMQLRRYWSFLGIVPDAALARRPEEELVDELDELVRRSVRYRLVSDVPVGTFLSGGVDSSLVTAVAAKQLARPIQTFTIGFSDQRFDEGGHARAVAAHVGAQHSSETLEADDLLELLPKFYEAFDEPFFDSSAFPLMAVSRLARHAVTVALSGDGADELFGGYHYYRFVERAGAFYALPHTLRVALAAAARGFGGHRVRLAAQALGARTPLEAFAFLRGIAKDFPPVLAPEVLARTVPGTERMLEELRAAPSTLDPIDGCMRIDAGLILPDDYLVKTDVSSMSHSLELREPLLDHELVEWAMRLPHCWKLRQGTNKYLLRKLTYRYVPSDLLERPKQGFEVPLARWLRGPLREWAMDLIATGKARSALPLDWLALDRLMALHQSGEREAHPLLWAVLMLLGFQLRRTGPAS